MRPAVQNALLIATNAILGASILMFAAGFFPHKTVLPGLAEWGSEASQKVEAPFDKVIFMVVDALRSDFVYGNNSKFHFTQGLIREGAAIPFTGHASPPTITMPRVKAITTGSVPSFLDLVLNFAESDTSATLATQDSWLAQLKAKPNGKLVMYGDDTWLRLFPGFFDRADGTTSFFVSDFTEVDNNVTRHIPDELSKEDWSGMIMHFLGLDHIGHKTGPRGPNMPGKQSEMDQIVKQIYESMESQPHLQSSVLVLLGDHGMNEAGNHGANSAGEVSTALTFISPKFKTFFQGRPCPARFSEEFKYYDLVDQSDLAPTLAALLGFPIPKNSLGAIIPQILTMWKSKADRFNLLYRNAKQIRAIAYATYPDDFDKIQDRALCEDQESLTDAQKLACRWLTIKEMHDSVISDQYLLVRDGSPLMRRFLKDAQAQLSSTASKYNLAQMQLGMGLCLSSLVLAGYLAAPSLLSNVFSGFFFICMMLVYAITMFASSYVEEEHQFWYWATGAWLIILVIKQQRVQNQGNGDLGSAFLTCALFGVARRWNQTGQKYAGEEDLVTEVFSRSPWLLWGLVTLTYLSVSHRLHRRPAQLGLKQMSVLSVFAAASAFLFKVAFTAADAPELIDGVWILNSVVDFVSQYPLTSLARVCFLGLANLVATALFYEKPWAGQQNQSSFLETLHNITSLFLATQTRTANIPLFLVFYLQAKNLRRNRTLHPLEATLTMLLLQYSSFFAFGGTNAISSVDLSNAYNGVGGYNVLAVGVLTFLSNWAGPVWWASATACVLRSNIAQKHGSFRFGYFSILTLFASVSVLAVMAACTILREHLFIWTVFSPKYLYMMAWTFAQHMLVNGVFCGIISLSG